MRQGGAPNWLFLAKYTAKMMAIVNSAMITAAMLLQASAWFDAPTVRS
jgi:hypothetical protein